MPATLEINVVGSSSMVNDDQWGRLPHLSTLYQNAARRADHLPICIYIFAAYIGRDDPTRGRPTRVR